MRSTIAAELLTIAEVADLLKCNQVTIRRMISRGELPAYRYGKHLIRIDPRDLDKVRKPVTCVSKALGDAA